MNLALSRAQEKRSVFIENGPVLFLCFFVPFCGSPGQCGESGWGGDGVETEVAAG